MNDHGAGAPVERFHATNGRISGYVSLGVMVAILALAVVPLDPGRPLGVAILALLGALLVWVVILRPAMWVTERDLVMRNMYHSDAIPLPSIDKVAVGQVTAVSVGEKRYVSPVVGYTVRQSVRRRGHGRRNLPAATAATSYQVFVEERIIHLAQQSRDRHDAPAADVRRTYAWLEIAGTVLLVAAFLVWLLVF